MNPYDVNINARAIGYCQGFVDGYSNGVRNNPYDDQDTEFAKWHHLQYKIGYHAGVAVYCQEENIHKIKSE